MKVLICGGTYIDTTHNGIYDSPKIVGGAVISTLVSGYSRHEVYLHTNFSTEEQKITKSYQKFLRNHWVVPHYSAKVASVYGRVESDRLIPGANIFETANTIRRNGRLFKDFDVFILTTDISENDFRAIAHFAKRNNIQTFVVTSGEYTPPVMFHETTLISLPLEENGGVDDTHLPLYHKHLKLIKDELYHHQLLQYSKVSRDTSPPKPPSQKAWRFLLQLFILAFIITGVTLFALYIFEAFSSDSDEFETEIDKNMPVDDVECSTIESCQALGDQYLDELGDYIDILDEPYIFFENRTHTTFIEYAVDDQLNLAEQTIEEPLPIGSEEKFEAIWSRFTEIFPDEYIEDIIAFRLFSDGEGNTLAYVDIRQDGTTLAVDIRDNDNLAAEYRTLIHEFGHIYSLSIEDFDSECGAGTELECLEGNGKMTQYIDRFWSQYGEEWLDNEDKSLYEREAFYNNHITDFHVPYQVTNAKEDYAVTFTRFIIENMPDEDSEQLKDVKVRSFYEDSELVALRVEILRNLLELEKEKAE